MLTHPGDAAVEIMTLPLAAFFLVGGLVRLITSLALRFPGWVWADLSGVVSILLGTATWRRWRAAGCTCATRRACFAWICGSKG